jgi:hypothetical protein
VNVALTTAREFLRHVLWRSGAYGVLTAYRAANRRSSAHLRHEDARARFAEIYATGAWQVDAADDAPGSGAGSSLAATATLRAALPPLLDALGCVRLLDVGCGDFTWMQHVEITQDYVGVDIVDAVVVANRERFGRPGRVFETMDAAVDRLPDADVVLCREVLFHLSFDDIRKVLGNLLSSPTRRFLIATSDRQTLFNADIPTGDFRLLNLEARPLRFPPPDRVIDDAFVSPRRIIGVWDTKRLSSLMRR